MEKLTHYVVIDGEGSVICVREKREDAAAWMAKRAIWLDEMDNTSFTARSMRLHAVYELPTEIR